MRKVYSLSLDEDLIGRIDTERGTQSRSRFIEEAIQNGLDESQDREVPDLTGLRSIVPAERPMRFFCKTCNRISAVPRCASNSQHSVKPI